MWIKNFSSLPSTENKNKLRDTNVALMAVCNPLKAKYHERLISHVGSDARDFYTLMRTKKCTKASLPLQMNFNGATSSGNARYEMLRDHLSSCFTNSDNAFPQDLNDFDTHLSDIYRINYSNEHESIWNKHINWFSLEEVSDAIDSLDYKKDSGPMLISAKFVIFNRDKLAPILLEIFNGIFPDDWKTAYLTPIPKKGNLADVTNYRGIGMQSVIPKLFDMLFTSKIYAHVDNYSEISTRIRQRS